jgi:hypothetical protein
MNKKLILLIILSVIAVFALIRGLTVPSKRKYEAPPAPYGKEAGGAAIVQRRAPRSDKGAWGRNPFASSPVASHGPVSRRGDFLLNGIMWDEKKPSAIINGDMVMVGDSVGSYKVVDISKDRVILTDGQDELVLDISPLTATEKGPRGE